MPKINEKIRLSRPKETFQRDDDMTTNFSTIMTSSEDDDEQNHTDRIIPPSGNPLIDEINYWKFKYEQKYHEKEILLLRIKSRLPDFQDLDSNGLVPEPDENAARTVTTIHANINEVKQKQESPSLCAKIRKKFKKLFTRA